MNTDPGRRRATEASSWQERYEASIARERDAHHPSTWPRQVWLGLLLTTLAYVAGGVFVFWGAATSGNLAVWVVAVVYGLYVTLIVIGRTRAWLRRNEVPPIATGQSRPGDR